MAISESFSLLTLTLTLMISKGNHEKDANMIKFNQLTLIFDNHQGKLPELFTNIWKQNYQGNGF